VGEPEVADELNARSVRRPNIGRDPVKPEFMEAEVEHGSCGLATVAVALTLRTDCISKIGGVDTAEAEARETDNVVMPVPLNDGEVVLHPGLCVLSIEYPGHHGVGLIGRARVEAEPSSDSVIS